MQKIKFTKMQAYGNDYVYVNAIGQQIANPNDLAIQVSDRHFGIGSDGLVLICSSESCDFRMRMFNPDGTEGEMCGNALRSLSKFVYYHHLTDKTELVIETLGGKQHVKLFVENGKVVNISADIGEPVFDPERIPVIIPASEGTVTSQLSAASLALTAKTVSAAPEGSGDEIFLNRPVAVLDRTFYLSSLSWGNPHTVTFLEDVDDFPVEKYGPAIERLTEVFPKKTNVTFAKVLSQDRIRIREWERGTGETIGCGTGCCTAVVMAHLLGKCGRTVDVEQIGGVLHVEWDASGRVHMTGPSHVVYEGEYFYEAE